MSAKKAPPMPGLEPGRPVDWQRIKHWAETSSEAITGRTLDEWALGVDERRRTGYARGHFRGGVMLQMEPGEGGGAAERRVKDTEIDQYVRRYGLADADDFVLMRGVPVSVVARNRKAARLPPARVPVSSKGPAQTLIVYMLNPKKYPL